MDMVKVGPVGGVGGTIWDVKGRDKLMFTTKKILLLHLSSFTMKMTN